MSSPITALPLSSFTLEISPTSTPAMLTVWPWPGVTACAVASSASTLTKSRPSTGTPAGSDSRWLSRITTATTSEIRSRTMIATKSRQVLADGGHLSPSFLEPNGRSLARSSDSALLEASAAWPVGSDLAAAGPFRFGGVCL